MTRKLQGSFCSVVSLASSLKFSFFLFLQVCGVEFDRKDIMMNKLVATTLESKFHVFDVRTQHPEKGFASLSEKVNTQIKYTVSH